MSPQPTSPPASAEHPKGSPAWLVAQAKELEHTRGVLMEKIGANRLLLRNLRKAGALTEDFERFVEDFYPEKEKGTKRSDQEIEATRRAREAARKG